MAFLSGLAGGTAIGDALIRIGADTRALRADMARMNAETRAGLTQTGQTVERQTTGWGKAFGAVKLGLAGMAIGLGAFAIGGIKAAREFDKSMSQVYALTGITGKALDELKAKTLALAQTLPQSPKQLAEGLYYIISSGFEAADAMKILEVAAKDATVGMTDVQTVADGLTSAMNAYAVSGEHAAEFSDIMTQTIVQGKAEWADLARSIGAVSVQGATAGVTFKEVSSAIANLTQVGLTAQRGSRNLAFLIRALNAPNNIAAKTFKNLGITVDENTLKNKGLIGTLEMMSAAAGKHHDVIVRDAKGNIDAAKSAEATAKANQGWAKSMQTMTGGAAGFLVAQILLQENSKKYTDILHSMDEAQGLTQKSFERMAESDPGLAFDILKNKIQIAAIEFGHSLMPYLVRFVGWLTEAVPHAFQTVGDVWRKYLQRPVGHILDAFGKIMTAVGHLFGSDAKADADGFATVLDSLGGTLGHIIDLIATGVDFIGDLFGNPAVQAVTRVIGVLLILKGTLGAILGLGGGLDRKFRSVARSLTGGFLFPNSKDQSNTPLDASAGRLTQAAEALKGAAAALKGGAGLGTGAGLAQLFGTPQTGRGGNVVGSLGMIGAPGPALRLGSEEDQMRKAVIAASQARTRAWMALSSQPLAPAEKAALQRGAYNTGLNLVKNTVSDLTTGIGRAAGALRQGAGMLRRGASAAVGIASRVFWPLMIADIAGTLMAEPIAGFFAKSTGFKRAAASIKEDFFGGLINMVKAWASGGDLFVALPQISFGKIKIKTETLGNYDLTQDQIDRLTGGGLAGALETSKVEPGVIASLQRRRDESVKDWAQRIKANLEESGLNTADVDKIIDSVMPRGVNVGRGYRTVEASPEAMAAADAALRNMVNQLGSQAEAETKGIIRDGVNTALLELGFDIKTVSTLPLGVKEKLATLLQNGISGEYSALISYSVTKAINDSKKLKPNILAKDIDPKSLAGGYGDSNFREDRPGAKAPGVTRTDLANEAFRQSLQASVEPAKDAYRKWIVGVTNDPTGYQQALRTAGQQFITQWGAQIRAAKTQEAKDALAKKMGMTWEQAQAALADAQAATGKPLLDALTAQLRSTILQAAKDGSSTAAPQAAAIIFSNLGRKDIWGDQAGVTMKEIEDAIANPNTPEAKRLRKAFASWFPKGSNAGTAKGFKEAYDAWVAAGMLDPSKAGELTSALSPLPDLATNMNSAMKELIPNGAAAFAQLQKIAGVLGQIGNLPPPKPPIIGYKDDGRPIYAPSTTTSTTTTRTGSGARHAMGGRYVGYAAGGRPGGEGHWVGEFGPEWEAPVGSYNVTSNSKVQSMLGQLVSEAARQLGGLGRGGAQQLFVEHMHLNSPAERQSILETIQFLAPAGR